MAEQVNELSDEQLCALNVIVCNREVCGRLAAAAAHTTLRDIVLAGDAYYDALEWECGLTRADWHDYVRAVASTNLGDLYVRQVGTGIDEGSFCFMGPEFRGYHNTYVVFRDGGAPSAPDAAGAGNADSSHSWPADGTARADAVSYTRTYAVGPIVVTGCGEGGAKALETVASALDLEIDRCVAFESCAISPQFVAAHERGVSHAAGITTHYHAAGTAVSPGVAALAGTLLSVTPARAAAGHAPAHALATLLDGAASFGRRVPVRRTGAVAPRGPSAPTGTGAAGRGVGTAAPATAGVHDFSDDRRDELLAILAEIDAEPWYDVGRWDLWYRLEQAGGRLTLAAYQDDVRTRLRTTLDIAGTTAGEVRSRFARAHELAGSYALRTRDAARALGAVAAQIRAIDFSL